MSPNRPVVLTLILCGGRGKRLLPLTRYQAKSTLPFAGRFRLIDVPIAGSLSAGFGRIYLLTQYLSSSVHNYIHRTYNSGTFEEDRFIRIDTVDQTSEHSDWYQGTADAVRHSMRRFRHHRPDHYLIMAADQVYRMDIAQMFRFHLESGADITVACTPACREEIYQMGMIKLDERGRIVDFLEKPRPDDPRISSFVHPVASPEVRFLVSMGTYLFSSKALESALSSPYLDFGRDVLPGCLHSFRMHGYLHPGFWQDLGTIRRYFDTNLQLAESGSSLPLFDEEHPILCPNLHLPAARIESSRIDALLAAEGCWIQSSSIRGAVLGDRSVLREAELEKVICIGYSGYENGRNGFSRNGRPAPCIGPGSRLKRVIVDQDARIGRNCSIGISEDTDMRPQGDYGTFSIRDGVIVIHQGARIPDGTVI